MLGDVVLNLCESILVSSPVKDSMPCADPQSFHQKKNSKHPKQRHRVDSSNEFKRTILWNLSHSYPAEADTKQIVFEAFIAGLGLPHLIPPHDVSPNTSLLRCFAPSSPVVCSVSHHPILPSDRHGRPTVPARATRRSAAR